MTPPSLVMRATLKRRPDGSSDEYGSPSADDDFEVVGEDVPCRLVVASKSAPDTQGRFVQVEVITAFFYRSEDVRKGDVIPEVRDRRDRTVMAGPMLVDLVTRVLSGGVVSHLEATLRRAS